MVNLKSFALWLLSQTPEFIHFCAEYREEIGDPDRKNYQIAIRPRGIVYKHLPSEQERYFSPS